MGDSRQVAEPSEYVTSHPGQLSLAIPPWIYEMSTSKSCDVSRHSPCFCGQLMFGWGLIKWSSAPCYGSGRNLSLHILIVQGAREFVVPTHMLGKYYTLPQSPQQVIKILSHFSSATAGVSNSRPTGRMRPAKATFAAHDTLSEILKIYDKNKSFYSFYSIFSVTQRNY